MIDEQAEADLREAVERRLSERLDAARRRREKTEQDRAAKNARRTAGLRQRHRRILARRTDQDEDDETPADGNVRPVARAGTAMPVRVRVRGDQTP